MDDRIDSPSVPAATSGVPVSPEVAAHARQRRIEQLDAEIAQLASDLFCGEGRFLALIGEFDQLEGWADGQTRSTAHWLSWRLGIAMPAARERVRVARRLAECPLIAVALAEGRISYSKVRAITRVATPETEESLVAFAMCATASQLERICSTWRRVQRQSAPDAADAQQQRRDVQVQVDEDGDLVLTARLPTDGGAVVAKAIQQALDVIFRAGAPEDRDLPTGARRADALVMIAEAFLTSGPRQLTHEPAEVPEDATEQTDEATDDAAEPDATADEADTDPTADAAGPTDVVAGATDRDEQAEGRDSTMTNGGLASDAWQLVVTVDADVLAAASDGIPHVPDWSDPVPDAVDDVVPRPVPDPLADPPMARTDTGLTIPDAVLRRIACDAVLRVLLRDADNEALGIGRRSRVVPPRLRRLLFRRDRGCRFPGCPNEQWADAHHILHWADGGLTDLDNLILLCRAHHTMLHAKGITIGQSVTDRTWVFTLPDGTPVPAVVALPGRGSDPLPVGRGLGRWQGDPARMDLIIDALVAAAGLDDRPPLIGVSAETPTGADWPAN